MRLGFQVDPNGAKKFMGSLTGATKGATITSASILGIATAAELMVKRFASSMEKLFYISKRTDASVQNIQALEYGAQQIGLEAGKATGALEAMSRAMRLNPGLTALLNNLGVRTAGRDKSEVLNDLVKSLSKMPHHVGALYAQMFGVDPDTLLALVQGQEEMRRLKEERIGLNNALGIDAQAAAEASKDYMNGLRHLLAIVGALGDKIAVSLLPAFRQFNGVLTEVLTDMVTGRSDIVNFTGASEKLSAVWFVIGNTVSATAKAFQEVGKAWDDFTSGDKRDIKNVRRFTDRLGGSIGSWFGGLLNSESDAERSVNESFANGGTVPTRARRAPSAPPAGGPGGLFKRLEENFSLPAGLLDSMWQQESGRGQNMLSRAGARGHFQFMPKTAKQYGVDNPDDLEQSATGAAHYMSNLLQMFGGDINKALAGYNWGEGNVQKYGLGAAPSETRDYVPKVLGRMERGGATINQRTEINIATTGGAQETASAVASAQARVMGDVVRNFGGQAVPR